jgi:hypothetical protein
MKQEEVIIGVILIAVGAILFFMGISMDNPFMYGNRGPFMEFFGIVILIVGLVVSIVGASSSGIKQNTQSIDIKCEVCGIPKGDRHFYVVTKGNKSLKVCEQCVDKFRKDVELEKKVIGQASHDESLNILKTRYAKGEITKEQFEQMKKDLEK